VLLIGYRWIAFRAEAGNTPRMRAVALLFVSLVLVACHPNRYGDTTAEPLDTPFPGSLSGVFRADSICNPQYCYFEATVSIDNPTDRDAYVQQCRLADDTDVTFYIPGAPAGLYVPPQGRALDRIQTAMPRGSSARELNGAMITCVGLDWHGGLAGLGAASAVSLRRVLRAHPSGLGV